MRKVTGPCRCACCLAWELDQALELLTSGRIGKAEKALWILRWRLAPEVSVMECDLDRQLEVRMKPSAQLMQEVAEG
ncbi:hypothetical protein [Geminicoccus harenae]|uniref:hypothetical protein n=1 Tax=Geminicoccus harenae TaxID=2498453 RepID=UPI00168BC768|nr:hypothetical protein [Geminicoccus harenae]